MTRLSTRRFVAPLLLGPLSLSLAGAQQFVHVPGLLPGPARWTEGLACVDVDGDGDLDLCFAEGEGFAAAGAKRQNVLLINQLVETGTLAFLDESVARLGQHLSNAKDVIAGDVNGDGWVDLLYLNAFNIDTPFLYINQGPAQPGFFTLESAARGFTDVINSASAQFGDLDDDGDLDVIFNDSGPSFLGNPGGKPRLYFNDGAGNFTENTAAFGAPTKIGHMDVQLLDFDGDWDLDFLGINRGTNGGVNHYLMLNDGTGT
ncbi:MAG: FG-GAP-like repeat-containing protein, partial [Planctomycetota bacterium]